MIKNNQERQEKITIAIVVLIMALLYFVALNKSCSNSTIHNDQVIIETVK